MDPIEFEYRGLRRRRERERRARESHLALVAGVVLWTIVLFLVAVGLVWH